MISWVVYGSEKELCWVRSVEQSGYDELSMTEQFDHWPTVSNWLECLQILANDGSRLED